MDAKTILGIVAIGGAAYYFLGGSSSDSEWTPPAGSQIVPPGGSVSGYINNSPGPVIINSIGQILDLTGQIIGQIQGARNQSIGSYQVSGRKRPDKMDQVADARLIGIDFTKGPHEQNLSAMYELAQLAKRSGYRKPKTASSSLGVMYFEYLKKALDKQIGGRISGSDPKEKVYLILRALGDNPAEKSQWSRAAITFGTSPEDAITDAYNYGALRVKTGKNEKFAVVPINPYEDGAIFEHDEKEPNPNKRIKKLKIG